MMTSETIDPAAREQILAAQNDEYEASTPGADRWRDRLAQRHRFGRALDKPKVRSDLDDSRWLVWFALYLAAVVVALVVIWLVAA